MAGSPQVQDLMNYWIPRKFGVGKQLGMACFASVALAVLITRNKMCIERVFPNKSLDVVYLALSFMQKWRVLMQSSQKTLVESMIKKMQVKGRSFRPSNVELSDVGYI
jgi:type III secretory pathway component EscR